MAVSEGSHKYIKCRQWVFVNRKRSARGTFRECRAGRPATADYKRLRVKTRNFVLLSNVTRTLLFHKLLTTSEHTMNIETISFYVSKECKNMQSLL